MPATSVLDGGVMTSVEYILGANDMYDVVKFKTAADKKIALQDGANVNVDETWLRYHAYNKKRKTYITLYSRGIKR